MLAMSSLAQFNLTQLGQRSYTQILSDIWGYAKNGKEYALVGVYNGTSIVDVTDPANPTQLHFVPGPNSGWRDLKTWGDYAYVTNESDSGLLVINMTGLPGSISYKHWKGNNGVTFKSAHNIFIDEQGFGYIVGADYGVGGAIVVDLFTDQWNPNVEIAYNIAYIHDAFVRGDTMWASEISQGRFAVVDMSDKGPANVPLSKVMARQNTPSDFNHNGWLSADGKYFFTTDEVSGAFIGAYDVSDLANISEVDRIQSNPGSGVIVHNTFWINNFLVTSYYQDGVHIVDATHPDNLVEMGNFDTSPLLSGDGFHGCWGVYPYLPSGIILASDIENGLYVLGPTYQQACYLIGNVTDSLTSASLSAVSVTIATAAYAATSTDLIGDYKTGFQVAGSYDVTFSKVGYYDKTITAVTVNHGVITTLDVKLKPQIPFSTTGIVRDSTTGVGIPNAHVKFVATNATYEVTCDGYGIYTVPSMFEGTYDVYAGQWGYLTRHRSIFLTGNAVDFDLPQGYYDDFLFDLGWTVNGNAVRGHWERGVPVGTTNGSEQSNPDADVPGDFGDIAYVTGNAGGSVGFDDVDDGYTLLTSPTFDLTGYLYPAIHYYRWFYNGGGGGQPNDSLIVKLHNGTTDTIIDLVVTGDPGESQWINKRFLISDYLTPTTTMKISFHTADWPGSGHLVEAGADHFFVYDSLHAPVADFSADAIDGCQPFVVHLLDESIQPQVWNWQLPGSLEGSSTLKNPTVTYPTPGTYDVTLEVSNITGADSITKVTFITVHESPSVTVSNGASSATASASGGLPPYTYLWNDPAQQATATATNLGAGYFTVTVTDQNGCTAVDSVFVDWPVGVSVWPNPSLGDFLLRLGSMVQSIRVYDALGRLVIAVDDIPQNELHIGSLRTQGVYTLVARGHGGEQVIVKLVVAG